MNSLKVGNIILLGSKHNRRPCKVIEINRSEPGKHGHSQYNVVGRDFITEKKVNDLFKHRDHYTEVDHVRISYMGFDYDGTYLSVMDDEGMVRNDLKLPSKLLKKFEKYKGEDSFTVHTILLTWQTERDETKRLEVVWDVTS